MKKNGLYLLGALSLILVLGVGILGCAPSSGVTGLQGERGLQGIKGNTGAQGIHGEKGNKGDKGDIGQRGYRGYEGEQGERGYTGTKGDVGATGAKGDKGDTGLQGLQGEQGIPGLNLIVAMGFMNEEQPSRLENSYNVSNVVWDSTKQCYVITLTDIYYNYSNYITLTIPIGLVFGLASFTGAGDGKLYVWLWNESVGDYVPGSFQFVVFRYPG